MPILDEKSNQQFIPYIAVGAGLFGDHGSPEGVQAGAIGSLYVNIDTGDVYKKTTAFNTLTGWVILGGGGSGTVTSFSAGNLSPLFTTSVATATTTPALTFAQVTQSANLIFAGPSTGAAAAPTFRALVVADIPSLVGGATNSIQYNNGASLFDGVAGILVDPASYSIIAGKTADQTGNFILRGFGGTQTTLTVNNPAASNTLKFPDAVGSANQVLSILSSAGNVVQTQWSTVSSPTANNPSALVGLTTVNGSASTFMRSDAAPPLSTAINPTWTQQHIWQLSNAAAVSIGQNGDSNPVLRVVTNNASPATGIAVVGNSAGGNAEIDVLSSGSNEGLKIVPKGTGGVFAQGTSSQLLGAGANGLTNPVFAVNASVASVATGLEIKGNAVGSGVTLSALSSGADESITLTPKGTGLIIVGGSSLAIQGSTSNLKFLGSGSIGLTQSNVPSNNYVALGFAACSGGATGVVVASAGQYTFSNSSSSVFQTGDTGIGRGTSAVTKFTNAGSGSGTFSATATTPAEITADQNNYNPGGSSYFQRWSTDASRQITGLTFTAAQVDGQVHEMWNVGSNDIVLVHQSVSSTAANRFANSSAANYTVTSGQGARFTYDATTLRWRVTLLT